MFAVVTPETIQLPPGAVLRLPGSWEDYQALSDILGDRAIPRIKYRRGEILLMSPLPQHGRQANVIADVVKVLLDYLQRDYEAFTPIIMKLPHKSGIEPDYCFYYRPLSSSCRYRSTPDLVTEIDVTSYTDINDYLPHQVPEVWLYKNNQLKIYILQGDRYNERTNSSYPNINLCEAIAECLQIAYTRNTSVAIRELRQKLLTK